MYLLNHKHHLSTDTYVLHLHSTMYLLNQENTVDTFDEVTYLHSTMYLLNRVVYSSDIRYQEFTFHYVSIKSVCACSVRR